LPAFDQTGPTRISGSKRCCKFTTPDAHHAWLCLLSYGCLASTSSNIAHVVVVVVTMFLCLSNLSVGCLIPAPRGLYFSFFQIVQNNVRYKHCFLSGYKLIILQYYSSLRLFVSIASKAGSKIEAPLRNIIQEAIEYSSGIKAPIVSRTFQ